MKLKRILAVMLSTVMLCGILPATVSMAEGKGGIDLVYMKYKPGYSSPATGKTEELVQEAAIPDSINVGDEILIGVKISDFNTINGYDKGLFWLGFGVKYDTNYVSIKDTTTAALERTSRRLLGEANPNSLFYQGSDDEPFDYYYTYSTADMDPAQSLSGDATAAVFAIAYSDGAQPSYVPASDSKYVAVLRFNIKAVPPAGTKVFDFSKDGTFDTLMFDMDGAGAGYAYEDTLAEKKLELVVDYDASGADLFPAPKTVQDVAVKSGTVPTLSPIYAGSTKDTISFANLKLNVTYTDGSSAEKSPTALYYGNAGATASAGLTAISGSLKATTAMDGKTVYAEYTEGSVTKLISVGTLGVQQDTIDSIALGTGNSFTTSYTVGGTLSTDGIRVAIVYKSGDRYSTVAPTDFATRGLELVFDNSTTLPTSLALTDSGKKVSVRVKNDTSKSVDIGTITVQNATAKDFTIGGTLEATSTYGAKTVGELLANISAELTMSDNSKETKTGYAAVTGVGITITVVAGDNTQYTNASDKLKAGTYTVKAEGMGKTKEHATKLTVNPLAVAATVTATGIDKIYDGTTAYTAAKIAVTNKVGSDVVELVPTYTYVDKNAGSKTLTIAYKLEGAAKDNYTTTGATLPTTATGDITAKELTVANIGKVDAVKLGATGDALKVSGTYTVTTADGLVSGDKVTVAYEATYADASAANPNVSLTATLGALDGDDKVNYTLKSNSAAATGEVADKVLEDINVTAPTGSFTTDTGISLDTLVVTPVYDGAADAAEAKTGLADILAAGYTVTINDVPVEASPFMDIKEGANTIKVTKGSISGTATVTVGAGAIVPSAPEGAIDPATNYIKVKLPDNKSTLEYAIVKDGEAFDAAAATWTDGASFDGVFKGLAADTPFERDTKYVIMVRSKAIDGGAPASEAVPSEPVKTLKNHITIKNSSDKELSSIYTDADSAEDINALSNIIAKPSRWIGYYQEKELKTALTYPLTIETETIIFADIKQGSGSPISSGSSSRPTVSIKFSGPITAKVGDKPITLEPTIENTTSKPSYKSSDEKVVTVDANGEVTFVGEGKATITATVSGKTATVEVTVGPADEEKPTPTPPVIETTYAKAYIIGDEHGAFRPDAPITRAEVAAIFSRLAKMDENKTYAADYSDVEKGMWYTNYIGFLTSTGVLQGFGDEFNSFKPNNYITRAEMCAVISRAMNYKVSTEATSFEDVATAAPWAVYYVDTLHKAGVINGYSSTEFGADKNITRAETVTMINRLLEDGELATDNKPTDVNSTYWAYNDIIKAMNDKKIEEKAE